MPYSYIGYSVFTRSAWPPVCSEILTSSRETRSSINAGWNFVIVIGGSPIGSREVPGDIVDYRRQDTCDMSALLFAMKWIDGSELNNLVRTSLDLLTTTRVISSKRMNES